MNIEINNRLSENLTQFCKCNNIELNWYISNCLSKQLALDKYGDLNEKISNSVKVNELVFQTIQLKNDSIIITTNKGELSIPLNKITSILPTTPSIVKDNIIEQQETKQSNRKRNLRTL